MAELRGVKWGEGFVVSAFRVEGGIKAAVARIATNIGPTIGNRNTFAKLQRVENPDELSDRDRWRAWLLLTALGQNPEAWDIPDSVVPKMMDVSELRRALRPGTEPPVGIEPTTYSLQGEAFSQALVAA